jgi:hypothetical protein
VVGFGIFAIFAVVWFVVPLIPYELYRYRPPKSSVVGDAGSSIVPESIVTASSAEWSIVLLGKETADDPITREDAANSIAVYLGKELTVETVCREGLVSNCELFTKNGNLALTFGQAAEMFVKTTLGADHSPPNGDWIKAFESTGFSYRGHTYPASTVSWGDFAAWLTHAADLHPMTQADN